MAEFYSKFASADFDKALQGGLDAANGLFLTEEADPTVPAWAKAASKPAYTADEVGADQKGAAADAVSAHNVSEDSHNDIRLLIDGLTARLNALADSDDTTLDQMSEIVAYIKANKGLIDSITTSKVNVSDIINNLTTNVTNKPLAAAQGVALKKLIDQISSGKLDADELTSAINAALAQAKNSGEFDGAAGKDGTSVTVKSVSESSADGGSNVVTFSDGKTLTVKNGGKGSKGDTGATGATGAQGPAGADGYTPVKGMDYWTDADKAEMETYIATELAKRGQLKPEFAESKEWLKDNGDQSKMYVLPDGFIYAWMLTETEIESGGYNNRLEKATETYNGTTVYGNGKGYVTDARLSSSGSISTSNATEMLATGFISAHDGGNLDGARIRTKGFVDTGSPMQKYVISYNASGAKLNYYTWTGDYIEDFTLDSATYGTGIKYIRISTSIHGTSPEIVTVNEEIKEGGTEIIITEDWANTGHAFVPADYEDRIIDLEAEVASLKNGTGNLLNGMSVFAPSPQLPADGSETADFNGDWEVIQPSHIYDYLDALVAKYPRFITKEVLGKDASETYDWCRYTCCRKYYDAWLTPNYPAMYGWTNGSTTIYSVSVSPRIGDTLYTTKYVGTAKGTVTAVSNANQTRTVGGVIYTRDKSKDVEPTLVFTETAYSPYFVNSIVISNDGIYNGSKAKISTISAYTGSTMTSAAGVTYTRYPLGDRNANFVTPKSIVIGGNEHGTGGDPAMPAMISARMIKDLCECKQMDNPFLNLLKDEYMMVFCPVINPWGLSKDHKSYYNSNGVNLDRNLDTPGWGNDTEHPQGDYGGSESEMQYFMNTMVASKAKIIMANHALGHGMDYNTGEAVNAGYCNFMFARNKTKYTEAFNRIAEVMAVNYDLVFFRGNEAPPENYAKTRSYIDWIGAEGGGLEMQSREGFVLAGDGQQFTPKVMEAAYTQLLQVLYMLLDKQEV